MHPRRSPIGLIFGGLANVSRSGGAREAMHALGGLGVFLVYGIFILLSFALSLVFPAAATRVVLKGDVSAGWGWLATIACLIAIVAAATLVTSASVATAGIIGWVGLVVPHIARTLVGPDFARLLPAAALLGGGFLLVIDTLARTMAPIEIPLGILTALVGTPFFIWLLASVSRTWSAP
jgi:ABC-type Fe3+-siderophore transport system permease subunit